MSSTILYFTVKESPSASACNQLLLKVAANQSKVCANQDTKSVNTAGFAISSCCKHQTSFVSDMTKKVLLGCDKNKILWAQKIFSATISNPRLMTEGGLCFMTDAALTHNHPWGLVSILWV